LIHGESGTGKELVARAIHDRSARQKGPYLAVHCAAIAKELLESELFGHEKGSFTGALTQRLGMFEAANAGTIFLDEIGEMELGLQSKLLRAIQEREIRRVGGNSTVKIDVRIVCATNRNLETEVTEKRFREDLFYRINVVPILLPPLRERKDDIPLLVSHFTAHFCGELRKPQKQFAPESLDAMVQYAWPGNVRELQHCIERLMVVVDAEKILPEHLQPIIGGKSALSVAIPTAASGVPFPKIKVPEKSMSLEEMVSEIERQAILNALHETKGVITEAAEKLGTTRRVLRYKMDKLGIAASESELKKDELQTA
jgi:transcriptional regulator with GAF, ATPase, and Fis domain